MMRPIRRAMHFDFHTMPGIEGLLSEFDAEEFAEKLSGAHVEYINFPARCNIGFSYYNTRIGKKYPGLERDILKETIDACHKRDIGVTAYVNVGLNHELSIENYGWCRIDREGRIYGTDRVNNFFRTMCLNSAYREYMMKELSEVLEYDVDGLFCDCLVTRPCYCPRCIKKMTELGIDFGDPKAVIEYQRSVVYEVYDEIRAIVPNDIYLYINSNRMKPGIHTHAEVECLPSSKHWGCDYFYPASSYARTRFDKLLYMTGRFQDCWGDLGGLKTVESMQHDMYDALLSGYGVSISDHLHPVTGLYNDVIERVGKVFSEKLAYEKFDTGATTRIEVGILTTEESMSPDAAGDFLKGAARLLCEAKIPFNIYDENGDFSSESLMIVPKDIDTDGKVGDRLLSFRRSGGKLLFIGEGIDVAVRLGLADSIKDVVRDDSDNSYFLLPEGDMRWATYAPARKFRCNGARELARHVDGVFNLVHDGLHTYYYRPQGDLTDYSAAATDGDVGFIAYNAFDAYASNFLKENKLLTIKVIDSLLPDRLLLTEGLPSTAIVGVTANDENTIVHLKATYPAIRNGRGIVEDHAFIPSATLSVRGEYSRVSLLPSDTEIPFEHKNGRTVFEAKNVTGYAAYMLK